MTASLRTIGLAGILVACGSAKPSPPNYAPAESAIHSAESAGAREEPRAAMHLGVAERELVEARSLARNGKSEEASFVVDGARTDAELALMVTRRMQAKNEAERATEVVRSLASSDDRGGAP